MPVAEQHADKGFDHDAAADLSELKAGFLFAAFFGPVGCTFGQQVIPERRFSLERAVSHRRNLRRIKKLPLISSLADTQLIVAKGYKPHRQSHILPGRQAHGHAAHQVAQCEIGHRALVRFRLKLDNVVQRRSVVDLRKLRQKRQWVDQGRIELVRRLGAVATNACGLVVCQIEKQVPVDAPVARKSVESVESAILEPGKNELPPPDTTHPFVRLCLIRVVTAFQVHI